MKTQPAFPPELLHDLSPHPEVSSDELIVCWELSASSDPLLRAPAPEPARIHSLLEALGKETRPPAHTGLLRLMPRTAWMAIAAMVTILLAVGLGWSLQPTHLTAPFGETLAVDLPDGSSVHLNSGASLTYGLGFNRKNRVVTLEGEGFFDVAHTDSPFIIETFNAEVTVLGTTFNVRAWPGEQTSQTVVTVVKGKVQVRPTTLPHLDAVTLTDGQRSRVSREGLSSPVETAVNETLAWRTGDFIFINQPLDVIFNEIAHRFGIEITASESIRSRTFTFSRRQVQQAEEVIKDLCYATQLRYRQSSNGFVIYSPE